nr:retrovirus-related Pol polyprotein from transposon TNT 1-94 [Tanacetum cinerariifolium]
MSARELWKTCSVYGTVVDVFIPSKKSKAGKRFAFVRFIKVFNIDRLVENLSTIWIGKFHLIANHVRRVSSYAKAVNSVYSGLQRTTISPSPVMVLDDSCLVERDLSMYAMGKMKDFSAIPNLYSILNDEGFANVKLSYLGESLKKYGKGSSDPVDSPMVEKFKLDEDPQEKAVNPTHYRRMAKPIEKHLHFVKRIFKYLRGTINRGLCMQLSGDRLVSWSSKRQKSAMISSTEAKYIALSGCRAKALWMRSQLTDYGLGFNKIPMYCDNKSAIALCCNNVQHSRSKHIDIRFHFKKKQVENGVVELYFVNTEYQLADIFIKALDRERIEFLINKLRMRSLRQRP